MMVDRLFLVPFLNGLCLAALLPVLGVYARLRGEWLASLGIGQVSAAGVVLAAFAGLPVAVGAATVALLAGATKTVFTGHNGADPYAVMLLLGWSAGLLLAANTAHGDDLSRALLQGQIYFTGPSHMAMIAAIGGAVLVGLPFISRPLLLQRFFPEYFQANGASNPRHQMVFDVLLAGTLAASAAVLGVMASFALVFIPPWLAFRWASGWRRTVAWSVTIGVAVHIAAFWLTIAVDQPYGPVLVALLLVSATGRLAKP